jgi:lipopolysaccharide transport system ATP-binding protein
MMPAIRIENLSKLYRIGRLAPTSYRTLRESVGEGLRSSWRRLRRVASRRPSSNGEDTTTPLWALRDISFEVGHGEVVGIIGPNGAGKSTLLKILSGITKPTAGGAWLHGRVGCLLEVGTGFHPELTGRENIYLNGAILRMSRREIARKFDEIVAFAGVEPFLDTPVKRYSSGMYVRLAFAVAAHLESEILIVDEVLAVGDAEFQKKCLNKMGDVARSGRTVLFVSHNMVAVQNLCGRAVLLAHGQMRCAGPCQDVLATYLNTRPAGAAADLQAYRTPGSIPILRAITLLDDGGQPAERFRTGGPVTIRIDYDSPVPLDAPVFGVEVEGLMGEKLFYLQTLAQHGPIARLPQRGVAYCRVPQLPLQPSSYKLSIYCSQRHVPGELDALERAVALEVDSTDYFGTGFMPHNSTGLFLVRAAWDFAAGDAAGPDNGRKEQ